MDIERKSAPLVAFLLVEDDRQTPAQQAEPWVMVSIAGRPFRPAAGTVNEIGDGWYSVRLTAEETDELGPLVMVAQGDGSSAWRDIHYVVEARSEIADALRIDEIAERAAGLIDPEVIAAGVEQAVSEALGRARLGLVIGPVE